MKGSASSYQKLVPDSAFREHYSNLIKAIWTDPELTEAIVRDPSILKKYGFTSIPTAVRFATAIGIPTRAGYDQQMHDTKTDGVVTFYIPSKPSMDDSFLTTAGDSCCCCCCPCCCCT